jgi:hypothetical protein
LRLCAEFIARYDLPIDDLYTHRWTLDQVEDAYVEFDRQRAGKAYIAFEELGEPAIRTGSLTTSALLTR